MSNSAALSEENALELEKRQGNCISSPLCAHIKVHFTTTFGFRKLNVKLYFTVPYKTLSGLAAAPGFY